MDITLSQKDLSQIQELIAQVVKTLEEKISFLPTKAHFDERMDKLSGEIQDKRDEQILHQGQHSNLQLLKSNFTHAKNVAA